MREGLLLETLNIERIELAGQYVSNITHSNSQLNDKNPQTKAAGAPSIE
jgi:hypothetical protein